MTMSTKITHFRKNGHVCQCHVAYMWGQSLDRTSMQQEVRMAERSKALRSGRSPPRRAWVRIPLLTTNVLPVQSMSVCDFPGLHTCDGAGRVNNKFGHFASVCPIFCKLSGNWVEMSAVGQD